MLRPLTLLSAAALALFAYACSTSNGELIPEPDLNAPDLDAGGSAVPARPDGAVAPPADAGPDADAAAPRDAGADADAAVDAGLVSAVRINEVLVDQAGAGAASTFLELRGAPGTPVDELRIRILASDGTVRGETAVANAPGDAIRPNGTWSVGGGTAPGHIDHLLLAGDLNAWGFDTPRGAVQLVRGAARTLVDVVGYDAKADAGALPPPPLPPSTTAEGRPAILTGVAGKSFGRRPLAADTNDNRADFCQMTPTAGATNAACDP